MEKALEVKGLVSGYGNKQVLNGVDLHVRKKEVVLLVGHNGAGKTTLLSTIYGLIPARGGEVLLYDQPVQTLKTEQIVRKGMALTPQGHGIFPRLTVADNLDLASYSVSDKHWAEQRKKDIYEMFPILHERRTQRAGTMSGGQQQMLAIGMSLMSDPKMLMLDEPSIGLAPVIVENLMNSIREIVERFGISVLLVEQNVTQGLRIADRVYAMKMGEIVGEEDAKSVDMDKLWHMF
jgi:branched-chain amino acid transport system ATP-binding protein